MRLVAAGLAGLLAAAAAARAVRVARLAASRAGEPEAAPEPVDDPRWRRGAALFDLDGTLYAGEMHLTTLWLLQSLPGSRLRRLARVALFAAALPAVALLDAALGEPPAVRLLSAAALHGLPVADVRVAAQGVTRQLWRAMRPEVRAEIEAHRRAGRALGLVTGNLAPAVADFAASLGAALYCTRVEEAGAAYTGRVRGRVMVGDAKRHVARAVQQSAAGGRTVGYGNSLADVPFMQELDEQCAVGASRGLREVAEGRGWRTLC